ncbi:hypothetical protein BIU97_10265 [Curtobacterium sp. MCBA15_009]|uniref:Rha family transcriptional regulator n=1 Tax=Curtobacterium sp. MCBA15_009 TaxID=1898737 RepID=UPI0008DE72B5|nr:Rha family transcriptional regulator [Curtobacterium sp. MCBA15_009]OII10503.1 hypothetical protein BIU97_10265 [Curtobacterium sp. MCBA15_009]
MTALDIINQDGTLVVTSETIAAGSGVQHKNVLELIHANRPDFEEFGQVAFETRPGYNNASVRVALLNEQQATLLMTYQRNTEQVRQFKKALVKAFFEMAARFKASQAVELTRSDLAHMILDAEAELAHARAETEVQAQRAALAEDDVAAFKKDDGLVVRAFIQKHFPDERESTLWSFFYGRGYVVNDPRGRWSETQQRRVPGANHHMPLQPGREWFHAPEQLDRNRKPRRQLRVRRDRELDLVAHLERHGFTSIRSTSLDVFGSPSTLRAV